MTPRISALALALAITSAPLVAGAQGVQRCESADGKVTYSNSKCPEGTASTRAVNTAPPIAVDEQKAARERAKRDAAEVKATEKARAQDETKAQRAAAEQKKADAKKAERCERAQRDLERARATRSALTDQRAATVAQMQKADNEIGRREAEATKACAR
jgi:recombination DNA repair RAD52 pathway protein